MSSIDQIVAFASARPSSGANLAFADVAPALAKNGYRPLPVKNRGKSPLVRSWQRRSPAQLPFDVDRFPTANAGILCGNGLVGIDIDTESLDHLSERLHLLAEYVPLSPLVRCGQTGRVLKLYQGIASTRHLDDVDIIGSGAYFVAFGVHPSGLCYRWMDKSPLEIAVSDLPRLSEDALRGLVDALTRRLGPEQPGKRADGRDAAIRDIVMDEYRNGQTEPKALASRAWTTVRNTIDLTRPKRKGRLSWSPSDVLAKAHYIIRKHPPALPKPRVGEHSLEARFRALVDAIGATGRLSPATVAVSHKMLEFASPTGACFASTHTIAHQLSLSIDTVKRARRTLRCAGLWSSEFTKGGRRKVAIYRPEFPIEEPTTQRGRET